MVRPATAIIVAISCLGCLVDVGMAAEPEQNSFVSLVQTRIGQHTLVVNYPWKVHQRPSVEVRLVTKKATDPNGARPLFFVDEYLKGEVSMKVYRCLDAASRTGTTERLKENGIEMEILGRRNSLGKPSVSIVRKISADDDPTPGSAAIFCHLPAWSVNRAMLYLDLPRQYFSESGQLHVWFLRGDKVLWEQRVDWPGYEK